MYPFLFINGGMATPHPDDIAIFSFLYPEPSFATTTGTITGTILAPNNTTPLTGVNVIARNILNPFDDAVSAISSDFTENFTTGSPLVGTYTLRGLTPGASYAIYVDRITNGGFSTPPRTLPGPEEFYNGALESNNAATDIPNVFTPVSAGAGATVGGIDIIFNRVPLVLGDDTFTEVFPPFRMQICGQAFDSLFINSNGSLTFGAGSTAFGESAAGMLTGPTRIAGLWDDLNPAAGGTVTYSDSSSSLTVAFTNVPEFSVGGANTFSIRVFSPTHAVDGIRSRFDITYGTHERNRRRGRLQLRRENHIRLRAGARPQCRDGHDKRPAPSRDLPRCSQRTTTTWTAGPSGSPARATSWTGTSRTTRPRRRPMNSSCSCRSIHRTTTRRSARSATTWTSSRSAQRPGTSSPSRPYRAIRGWTRSSASSTPAGTCCSPTMTAASGCSRGSSCRYSLRAGTA